MNSGGFIGAEADSQQELLQSHSVGSSERGFLDTSVNHFILPCVVRGGACENPLAIVPQFSSLLHAGNVRATWQGIEPYGTGSLRTTPSQAIEEKRLRHQFNSRFLMRTIQSHHITPYCTWDDGVSFEPLALLATRYISIAPCILAGLFSGS